MGKISPVSAKYIVHAEIKADGTVDKPDVIGAIFGQTEGLLGTELELRELQKNGRIGRIEVNLTSTGGKASGEIIIPSSLDMAETAIIAGSLETIQRIGPCNSKILVKSIEDVRVTKREYVVNRAKELLKGMIDQGPESAEIMDQIKEAVRVLEITEFGPDKLPAGPGIAEAEDLIIVEGRADVLALLRNGFKNVIGINGTSIPPSVAELSKKKTSTVFVDGDRGGFLIVKELSSVGEVDFVAQAPSGKEVEELTKKEINKCLRARVPLDQFIEEAGLRNGTPSQQQHHQVQQEKSYQQRESRDYDRRAQRGPRPQSVQSAQSAPTPERKPQLSPEVAKHFSLMLEELVGTKGAYLLDSSLNILGKIPVSELSATLNNLPEVHTAIIDEPLTAEILAICENSKLRQVVASEAKAQSRRIRVFTQEDLVV